MYEFHQNYLKEKYVGKTKLLSTDTDSLTYEFQTINVRKDFFADKCLSLILVNILKNQNFMTK